MPAAGQPRRYRQAHSRSRFGRFYALPKFASLAVCLAAQHLRFRRGMPRVDATHRSLGPGAPAARR
jgi:hypothetical protein